MQEYLEKLNSVSVFDKKRLFHLIMENCGEMSISTLEKYLSMHLQTGDIARVGRNAYCIKGNLHTYEYSYGQRSKQIADILVSDFYNLDFRIMELYQLNSFLNHQIAHNVIFVYVEKELCAYVFERLKKEFEGKILINPREEDFYNYRTDDIVIVRKLLTESPKVKECKWHTGLEKMLVDIFSEELLKSMFSASEYPTIFETAFGKYVVDESQMFRYAKRRKNADRIKRFLQTETIVKLRVE